MQCWTLHRLIHAVVVAAGAEQLQWPAQQEFFFDVVLDTLKHTAGSWVSRV